MTTPPPTVDAEQLRAAVDQLRAALRAYVDAVAPAVRQMAEQFARLAAALREAGVVDHQGRPTRRDRPAWQSPYGPPPRRRH